MSITIQPIQRAFRYNGIALPDVPGLQPREVRDLYSAQYPELISAEIESGEVRDGTQEFTFRKAVGTKGAGRREGPRFAAVRRRADDEANGTDLCGGAPGSLPQSRRAGDCARALSDFASQNLRTDRADRAEARVDLPSELLAPLP